MSRIDVHHHILPDLYTKAWLKGAGIPSTLKLPEWTPERSLAVMDENGIGVTILSLPAPCLSFIEDHAQARSLSRKINEYAASLAKQYPDRFGFFATLPSVDDIPGCLDELAYAFDELKADGVTLLTSYKDRYLGESHFEPLWEELDRRSAVIHVHPNLDKLKVSVKDPVIPQPILDFPHETTRAGLHMLFANVPRRFPKCKIILSHGGGTLPFMATRVAYQTSDIGLLTRPADEFLEDARSFYYDLALTGYDVPVDTLKRFAKKDHILYGSDFPFVRPIGISRQAKNLDEMQHNDASTRVSMDLDAALKIFPRFALQRK